MPEIPASLISAIRNRRAILFAGAGLSSSLGLPLFDKLTAYLVKELGMLETEPVDFAILAEYFLLVTKRREDLFEWMKRTWHPPHLDIQRSPAHKAILQLNFPLIYTTNYDSWLERAFASDGRPYRKVINVSDLAETQPGETEIIKFHGDFDDPDSIVLTESHFLRRMGLDAPLDIRLRSDSLAQPILFVGYSLSDPNIRYLLYRLDQLWGEHKDKRGRPNSYILIVERDPIQERLLRERGVEPIVWTADDPSNALCDFFSTLCGAVCRGSEPELSREAMRTTVSSR